MYESELSKISGDVIQTKDGRRRVWERHYRKLADEVALFDLLVRFPVYRAEQGMSDADVTQFQVQLCAKLKAFELRISRARDLVEKLWSPQRDEKETIQ